MDKPFAMKKESAGHERWMKFALQLARKGEGLTRPNPPVGAVITKNRKLISTGFHCRAGADHAEITALKSAGKSAKNASLYITLEPCSTFGKTPPCVEAIIRSGVREVVVATLDPNPRHQGRGIFLLRKAGIKVVEGICRPEAQRLIEPFKKWILTGRPYVTLKLAVSLDGKIADRHGRSRWITGKKARMKVHDLRRQVDAVLVGAGTVLADNPSLLPKPSHNRRPYRIILDARGITPPKARVLRDVFAGRTIMATTPRCPVARRREWSKNGARVWTLPPRKNGVSIASLMKKAGRLGLLHVLCEGGAGAAGSLVNEKAADEFIFILAPRLIGGHNAPSAIGGHGWRLPKAPHLRFTECRRIGDDILIRAKPVKENTE